MNHGLRRQTRKCLFDTRQGVVIEHNLPSQLLLGDDSD